MARSVLGPVPSARMETYRNVGSHHRWSRGFVLWLGVFGVAGDIFFLYPGGDVAPSPLPLYRAPVHGGHREWSSERYEDQHLNFAAISRSGPQNVPKIGTLELAVAVRSEFGMLRKSASRIQRWKGGIFRTFLTSMTGNRGSYRGWSSERSKDRRLVFAAPAGNGLPSLPKVSTLRSRCEGVVPKIHGRATARFRGNRRERSSERSASRYLEFAVGAEIFPQNVPKIAALNCR